MERSLFGFIIRYSKREQLLIVPLVVASMLIYFSMLDLPKAIINEAIQGKRFPEAESTVAFLKVHLTLIVVNGGLKFQINTMKGWLGERMLRRLRYALFDRILADRLAKTTAELRRMAAETGK